MIGRLRKLAASEFVRFIFTGGIAAAVNIGARLALSNVMGYQASILVAYLIGMTTAFVLAKSLVFQASQRSTSGEYLRFSLVNLVALGQVWLVSVGLDSLVFPYLGMSWHPETVAHIIGVVSPVVTSYYGHKFFSFRRGGNPGLP